MDARVIGERSDAVLRTAKPAHDTTLWRPAIAFSQIPLQPTLRCPVGLVSGPGAGPWSLFPFPLETRGMERWEAPGSLAIGSLRPALRSAGLRAELPGPKVA